jgi:pimeloyl-ACP methyl ester carboxylesterase
MMTRGWQLSARGELSALVTAATATPWTLFLRDEAFDPTAPHPTPVVLIHGLFGSASNFLSLRRVLAARGVSNVHSFSYLPGIDVPRVARRLGETIEALCTATRSAQVDVVGHSLGGLVGRYLTELPAGRLVRRLVTLGAPYLTTSIAPQELAIFAAHDALISPPHPDHGALHGRTRVVPDCGHLGLLYHPDVLRHVARHLARPRRPTAARGYAARLRRAGALPARAQLAIG